MNPMLLAVLCTSMFTALPGHMNNSAQDAKVEEKPNILFIMSDDHGWQAISAYGRPDGTRINQTPSIDRIASEGMRFDRFFVENSICAPSRAAFLSGCFSSRHGVPTNAERFDGTQPTWPALLHDAGYRTGVIGKWHLKSTPVGFDVWEVLIGQGVYYNSPFLFPGGKKTPPGYVTEVITEKAIDTLRTFAADEDKKPFALLVQQKAPHRRWDPNPEVLARYEDIVIPEPPTLLDDYAGRSPASTLQEMTIRDHLDQRDLKLIGPNNLTPSQQAAWDAHYQPINAAYVAAVESGELSGDELTRAKYQRYARDYLSCVASVDDGVGKILDTLDELGLSQDTIVIYTSDQGWYVGEHGWYDKRWMYEESFRTPFIIKWPGVIPPGSTSSAMAQNIDLAPTMLDIAGISPPERMHGKSLVPILEDNGVAPHHWRTSVYYRYYESHGPHRVPKHDGMRTDRWKLIWFPEVDPDGEGPLPAGCYELYDLHADPDEVLDVSKRPEHATVLSEGIEEIKRLRLTYGP